MLRTSTTSRLTAAALVLVAGAAAVYLAARAGGVEAGLFAAVAAACALALLVRSDAGVGVDAVPVAQALDVAILALPGALTVYFSFDSGGYFPSSPAVAVLVLLFLLILRVTLDHEPFAAFSVPLAIAAGALGLFAVWTLASALWSDATARALVEFDRAFAYLLLLLLCGTVVRSASRLRWMAASVAAGIVVVAVAALATRLYPDRFPTHIPAIGPQELSYPLTYSNGLGLLCVLGAILCLYFATSARRPAGVRALGAAALPLLGTVIYLTLSRGPVAAAVIGVAAYLVFGRPRALVTGLVAAGPTSAIAIASAYHHPLLTSRTPTTDAAASQGHRVAAVVVACVVGAAVLRMVLAPLDERLDRYRLPGRSRRPVLIGAWSAVVLIVIAVGLAANAPSRISDQYHRFVDTAEAGPNTDIRASIFDPSNRGLIDNWAVALEAFGDEPLHGRGAGTYEVLWFQNRPAKQAGYDVTDGHSLYLEALGELGVVGFLLIATLVISILVALAPAGRGPNRALYAALFGTALAWAAHAGVDWDWEMPAVTVGVIALGGAALAAHHTTVPPGWTPPGARVTIGVLLLAAAMVPVLLIGSQRDLNAAAAALRAGNCTTAVDHAADSIDKLSIRPEPYEVLANCQQRRGRTGFAIQAMREAVQRDPNNWRYHFGLGVLLGGAGQNARVELLEAQRLNPHDEELNALVKAVPAGRAVNWDLELLGPGGATGAQR